MTFAESLVSPPLNHYRPASTEADAEGAVTAEHSQSHTASRVSSATSEKPNAAATATMAATSAETSFLFRDDMPAWYTIGRQVERVSAATSLLGGTSREARYTKTHE